MMWFIAIQTALASPVEERIQRVWDKGAIRIAESGAVPVPDIDKRDIATLANGEVVKQRRREEGSDWAVGLIWLPHPVDAIWTGMVDNAHDELTKNLRETQIAEIGTNNIDLFQELTLPRPFHARHWILNIQNPEPVFTQTKGTLWQRVWTLRPESHLDQVPTDFLDAKAREENVYTPVNEGGWSLLPDGDHTLVIYQARIAVGGVIPDELVVRFAIATIDELLIHVGNLAARQIDHYTGSHEPLLRPDMSEIPRFP